MWNEIGQRGWAGREQAACKSYLCLPPSPLHYAQNTDVQLYPMMLTLKQLKPKSLLPMIKNRPLSVLTSDLFVTPGKKKKRQTIYQAQ